MSAKRLSTAECVKLLEPEVHQQIWDSLARYKSKGLLVFSNHDLCDPDIGHKFAIGHGPHNTIQSPPADGRSPVGPPGMPHRAWQYYLDAYSDDLVEGQPQQ